MKKCFYPAIFHEEAGGYWVEFYGLDGCVTQGDSFEEAYDMAVSALGLYLENENGEFSEIDIKGFDKSKIPEDGFLVMVEFDEVEYLKRIGNTSVKKTLTIPKWLDILAVRNNINFSKVLQNALIDNIMSK